jgi:Prokaryotic homologs of the JAB domain
MSSLVAEIKRAHQAVKSGRPGARRTLERLQDEYRRGGTIIRDYVGEDAVQLVEAGERPRSIERQKTVGQPRPERPSWQLGDKEELSYRDVELRENFVSYKVDLTPEVKEAILDEIKRAHRDAGEQIEVAGWLFAPYRPRGESDSIQVVHATRSGSARGSQTSVTLCDPIEVMAHVRRSELAHLHLCGDWHCHTRGGSQLPSHADARAWAGTTTSRRTA